MEQLRFKMVTIASKVCRHVNSAIRYQNSDRRFRERNKLYKLAKNWEKERDYFSIKD